MKKERFVLRNYLLNVNNTNKDGTYPTRKDPKTYLYNSSWNDEIITKQDTSGKPVEAV